MANSIVGHPTLPNDLVVHYSCEDVAGLTVTDDTPHAHHATVQVDLSNMTDLGGVIDKCFYLNGLYHLLLPAMTDHFSDDGTLVLWVKNDLAISPVWGFNHVAAAATDNEAWPYTDGDCYIGTFRNGSRVIFTPDAGIDRTEWHMVTIVQKPGANGYKVYQNLVEVFSGTGESTVSISLVPVPTIGQSRFGTKYDGRVDQIALWSRALTFSEITDLYNSGAGLPYESAETEATSPLAQQFGVGFSGTDAFTQKFKVVTKRKRFRDLTFSERGKLLQKTYRIGK